MRKHPVFYVGLLKPYLNPSSVDFEGFYPLPRPKEADNTAPEVHMGDGGVPGGQFDTEALRENVSLLRSDQGSLSDNAQKSDSVDRHGHQRRQGGGHQPKSIALQDRQQRLTQSDLQQSHAERLLTRRLHQGNTQYQVKWWDRPHRGSTRQDARTSLTYLTGTIRTGDSSLRTLPRTRCC
ncbi:unnamed protein product [Peronospora belbahrii]|uniref:Uncharacterized protein n=1 Tax=Peronospora belbahrii TaxID=622444 RepID=A0AAU9KS74_9STRA|nr:unnamed protein product [Peronospora belbahrii]